MLSSWYTKPQLGLQGIIHDATASTAKARKWDNKYAALKYSHPEIVANVQAKQPVAMLLRMYTLYASAAKCTLYARAAKCIPGTYLTAIAGVSLAIVTRVPETMKKE